jgi:hypothetical protein
LRFASFVTWLPRIGRGHTHRAIGQMLAALPAWARSLDCELHAIDPGFVQVGNQVRQCVGITDQA